MVVPHVARAQQADQEAARKAFEEGVALEKKGSYEAAFAKFSESRAIIETLGNRFHVAFCLEMMGQMTRALAEYEQLEDAAKDQNKADVIEQTRARMDALRPRVPKIVVKLSPKDAELAIDGKVIPPEQLGGRPVRVDPGEHTVTARAPSYESATKKVALQEGGTSTLELALEKTKKPEELKVTASPPPKDVAPPRDNTLAIATTAGAVAFLGAGLVTFLLAGSAQSDAETTCKTKVSCEDERSTVRTLDALALTGFVGGAALGAVSVYFWTKKPVSSASRPATRLVGRPTFVGLEGWF